ncbi:hypothetical protein SAMN04488243_1502 [Thermus arciformis]|uniref:Uncharacterized protein n=1 Tax=Thermus arciformis TaxID=482827 RepID=A0A1G7KTB9_9DEIN|nr:hypothetical protein [Thermus arciformis]SDF40445.1 hypothetical protein SAMN04488243_1502 [Thermus arciformis]
MEEAREERKERTGARHPAHQATLFLEGRLGEEGFQSPRLPRGLQVAVAGYALSQPEEHRGEGVFTLWPRTDEEGRLTEAHVALKLKRPMEGPELVVHGVLLHADRRRLVVVVQPKSGEAFRIVLGRARGFTAFLEPRRAYRFEGALRGGRLLAERAFPLGKWVLARKGGRPLPEPIEGDRNPHLEGRRGKGAAPEEAEGRREEAQRPAPPGPEGPPKPPKEARPPGEGRPRRDPVRVWRAPEEEEAPGGLGLPPPLPKGQVMGLVGEGPYYLVLRPQALDLWWPKVERFLPEFPRKYEVRLYPDGSRAVVAWDLEALKVWYKRVLRG